MIQKPLTQWIDCLLSNRLITVFLELIVSEEVSEEGYKPMYNVHLSNKVCLALAKSFVVSVNLVTIGSCDYVLSASF